MLNIIKMAIEVMILDPVFYLEMPKYISYAKVIMKKKHKKPPQLF